LLEMKEEELLFPVDPWREIRLRASGNCWRCFVYFYCIESCQICFYQTL
jgi:hypothetical protein